MFNIMSKGSRRRKRQRAAKNKEQTGSTQARSVRVFPTNMPNKRKATPEGIFEIAEKVFGGRSYTVGE